MNNIWFTSDTHFGHNKAFLYEPRGFTNIYEHDKQIIDRWNDFVETEDEVFHLGDVMLGDNNYGLSCVKQLNGKLHIIRGNHCTNARIDLYKNCDNVIEVCDGSKFFKYKKYHFYLSHYPTITANNEDADAPLRKYVINLFGHTHQKEHFYNGNPLMYNVGMDAHDCYPICIDEIIEEIRAEHHKNICNS